MASQDDSSQTGDYTAPTSAAALPWIAPPVQGSSSGWMTPADLYAATVGNQGVSQNDSTAGVGNTGTAPSWMNANSQIVDNGAWAQSLGFDPTQAFTSGQASQSGSDNPDGLTPAFQSFLQGLTPKDELAANGNYYGQYFDANGNPVGQQTQLNTNDSLLNLLSPVLMAAGAGFAGLGGAAAGVGDSGAALGTTLGGTAADVAPSGLLTDGLTNAGLASDLAGSVPAANVASSVGTGLGTAGSVAGTVGSNMDDSDLLDAINGLFGDSSGVPAATGAPAYTTAAQDSSLVGGAPYSGSVPSGVNLGSLGGVQSTGGTLSSFLNSLGLNSSNIKTGSNVVGLLNSLINGSTAKGSLSQAQLQSALQQALSPYNNFTPANQAAMNGYFGSHINPQYASPNVSGIVPLTQQTGHALSVQPNTATTQPVTGGPLTQMAQGGWVGGPTMPMRMYAGGGFVSGVDPGQADTVPAKLSHGEYVFDADSVSALGDGNNASGAQRLDQMRENIRAHNRSAPPDSIPPKAKGPLQYLNGARRG